MSQQRPGLQGFLRLVLLLDRQQRLEELGWLRREDFEGAGVEKRWALRNQTCAGTFSGSDVATQTLFLTRMKVWTTHLLFLYFTWILLAFDGCGAKRALLEIAVGAVHMITVVLNNNTRVILESIKRLK